MFFKSTQQVKEVDLIHANWSICGAIGGIVGYLSSKPVITTFRGEDVNKALSSIIYKLIMKTAVKLSSNIICVSDRLLETISKITKVEDTKIKCIPNGIDSSLMKQKQHEYLHYKNQIKLISVGSLTENKNLKLVIYAVNELIKSGMCIKYDIVGDGSTKDELEKLISKYCLQKNIHIHGILQPERVYKLISNSTALVLSSFREGRPNVILESMAIGTPVIASDIGGVRELISDGYNGFLFDPTQHSQLVSCITKLNKEPSLLKKIQKNAKLYIQSNNLFWNSTGELYLDVYKAALSDD